MDIFIIVCSLIDYDILQLSFTRILRKYENEKKTIVLGQKIYHRRNHIWTQNESMDAQKSNANDRESRKETKIIWNFLKAEIKRRRAKEKTSRNKIK